MREKLTREEYLKNWRARNKLRLRAYNADYYKDNDKRIKERRKRLWYCPVCHFPDSFNDSEQPIAIGNKARHLKSKKHKKNVRLFTRFSNTVLTNEEKKEIGLL